MPRLAKPKDDEPIRLVNTRADDPTKPPRWRYLVVVDAAAKGAPRKQVTRTCETLTEARDFVSEVRGRVDQGTFAAPSKMTLRELTEKWLEAHGDNVRQNTISGYRDAMNNVLDRIGDRPVQSLTPDDISTVLRELGTEGGRRGKPLKRRSVAYALLSMNLCFEYGVLNRVLAVSPSASVKLARGSKTKTKAEARKAEQDLKRAVWQPDELKRFVANLDQEELWVQVAFRLTACGLRRSEVLGIDWPALDVEAEVATVESSRVTTGAGHETDRDDAKSEASERSVPYEEIWPGTTALIKKYRAQQAADRLAAGEAYSNPDDLVIVNALGEGIHPWVYTWRWRVLREKMDLPWIKMHNIRHTLALILHRNGVAPADAAAMLGHTLQTHMAYYLPKTDTGMRSAAAKLGKAFASIS